MPSLTGPALWGRLRQGRQPTGKKQTTGCPQWQFARREWGLTFVSIYRHVDSSLLSEVSHDFLCWVFWRHSEMNLLTLSQPKLGMTDEGLSSQLTHNKPFCRWVAACGDAAESHTMHDLKIPAVFWKAKARSNHLHPLWPSGWEYHCFELAAFSLIL